MRIREEKRLEILGALDELNSFLGVARSFASNADISKLLAALQDDLFLIQAEVGRPPRTPRGLTRSIGRSDGLRLERLTHRIESKLEPLKHFILVEGTRCATLLQYARTLARRAERRVALQSKGVTRNQSITLYLDRLACLLFRLARWVNARGGIKEHAPAYWREQKAERRN